MNKRRILAYLLLASVAGFWIVQAGSLEPAGPPAPTMTSLAQIDDQLSGLPSAWYRVIDDPLRFKIVMNGEAALDTETGIVWERIPSGGERTWWDSINHCLDRSVGNRMGWRLPVAEELFSLVDPGQSMPALPANHPFTVPPGAAGGPHFWSMTAVADGFHPSAQAISIGSDSGTRNPQSKTVQFFAWCVRGKAGYDGGHG